MGFFNAQRHHWLPSALRILYEYNKTRCKESFNPGSSKRTNKSADNYVPDIDVTSFLTSSEFEQNEDANSLIEEMSWIRVSSLKLVFVPSIFPFELLLTPLYIAIYVQNEQNCTNPYINMNEYSL